MANRLHIMALISKSDSTAFGKYFKNVKMKMQIPKSNAITLTYYLQMLYNFCLNKLKGGLNISLLTENSSWGKKNCNSDIS